MGTSLPSDVYTNTEIGGTCNMHGGQKFTYSGLKISKEQTTRTIQVCEGKLQ